MPKKYTKKHPDKKLGRKPKDIDVVLLEKVTKLQLSDKIIASIVGCHVDTLHTHFSDQMEEWRNKSKGKIADVLYDEALNKRQPWALKTIAQRHLGYADKVEQISETKVEANIKVDSTAVKKILDKLNDEY